MKNLIPSFNLYNTFILTFSSIIIGLLTASFVFINNSISAPPASPYAPGETLSPNCAPGDTNCTINEALFGPWQSNSSSIFTTSSNVGINSTSPNYDLTSQGSVDMTNNLSNGDTAFIELKDQLSSPAPPGVGGVGLFNYPDSNPGDRNFIVAGNASSVGTATNTTLLGFENTNTNEETRFQALGRLGLRMTFSDGSNTTKLRTVNDPVQGWQINHPTSSSGNKMLTISSAGSAQAVFKDKGEFILTSDSSNTGEPLITFEDSNANPKLELDNNGNLTINDNYTFPTADGSSSQTLKTDGNGNITFENDIDTTATPKLYKENATQSFSPTVTGDNAIAIGGGNNVQNAVSAGGAAVIGGNQNQASQGNAFVAAGYGNVASNFNTLVSGYQNSADGGNSAIIGGINHTVSKDNSAIVGGDNNTISGSDNPELAAIVGGKSNEAKNLRSAIIGGDDNRTDGQNTLIGGGEENTAHSYSEVVFGTFSTNYNPTSTNSVASGDRLFNVGNGQSGSRSDAFTILKNGQVGIGIDNFEASTTGQMFQVRGTTRLGDTEISNSGSNTATLKIGSDSENIPGCIQIADSDGTGSTFIRANDGTLTANTNDCSQ